MKPTRVKDPIDMALLEARKVARTAIRMRYTILADRELNRVLPEVEAAVQRAALNGDAYDLDIPALIEGLEG